LGLKMNQPMDYKKTSVLLKKIKSLHNTLMDNEDQPSSMEQELMKSYLRDFYDSFVSGEGATDIFNTESNKTEITKAAIATPTPVETQTSQINSTQENLNHPIEMIEPKQIQKTVPVGQNPVQDIVEEQQKVVEKQADAKTDVEMVVEGKDVIKQFVNDPVDADLVALFNEAPVTDLKDKLALLPINDLTKSLSINERFFTIQELFGGNSDLFQTTLQKLNSFSNFEEASEDLMSSVASEYDWASSSKQKKAANFIKLIRRRYQ